MQTGYSAVLRPAAQAGIRLLEPMVAISELQDSLPNFPTEILEEWLFPYAESEGWPPAESDDGQLCGRWRYLLGNKPLRFWRALRWEKVQRHISVYDLNAECQDVMLKLVLASVRGETNLYSVSIPNLKMRFDRIVEHIRATGELPCAPTLVPERYGLSIVDGNHRMAAYLYCYGYFKLEVEAKLQLRTKEIQEYWIGIP